MPLPPIQPHQLDRLNRSDLGCIEVEARKIGGWVGDALINLAQRVSSEYARGFDAGVRAEREEHLLEPEVVA